MQDQGRFRTDILEEARGSVTWSPGSKPTLLPDAKQQSRLRRSRPHLTRCGPPSGERGTRCELRPRGSLTHRPAGAQQAWPHLQGCEKPQTQALPATCLRFLRIQPVPPFSWGREDRPLFQGGHIQPPFSHRQVCGLPQLSAEGPEAPSTCWDPPVSPPSEP